MADYKMTDKEKEAFEKLTARFTRDNILKAKLRNAARRSFSSFKTDEEIDREIVKLFRPNTPTL